MTTLYPIGKIDQKIIEEPENNYFAAEGISHSALKKIGRSPAALLWDRTHKKEPTPDMIRGKALHCLLLTPHLFDKAFIHKTWDARTKEGKAARDDAEAKGLTPLDAETYEEVRLAAKGVLSHPIAGALVQDASLIEASVYWMMRMPDVVNALEFIPCKGRIDGHTVVNDRSILWDLKWVTGARPSEIERVIYTQQIHSQLAWYTAGLHANGVPVHDRVVIAVEQDAPYEVYVYRIKPEACEVGMLANNERVKAYVRCEEAEDWPGGITEVLDVGLPPWAVGKDKT